jgi:divalent metal cation (Fe/Co/Zn/Cd) transporter
MDDPDAAGQRRTALTSIVAATLLVLLKLVTGLLTGSLAVVSAGSNQAEMSSLPL